MPQANTESHTRSEYTSAGVPAAKQADAHQDKLSTEEKILAAAKQVFHKKGYAGTRTRDIADAAGINLALLNYYFRSKSKLFDIVMIHTLSDFLRGVVVVINDKDTTLEQKVAELAARYIDLILAEPNVPSFIIGEMRASSDLLHDQIIAKIDINHSVFAQQYQAEVDAGRMSEPNVLHFLLNLLGMVVFPFVIRPVIQQKEQLNDDAFIALMEERKARIPIWISAMMQAGSGLSASLPASLK